MDSEAVRSPARKGAHRGSTPVLRLVRLSILFLGFAVVFWGSHDKVSLYRHTAGTSVPVAKAKLLSGRDHAAAAVRGITEPPAPAVSLALLLFAAYLLDLSKRCANRTDFARPLTPSPPLTPALRRRPPPSALVVFA